MTTDGIRKFAIYGKGGVGKSITSSNISAALSHMGYQVLQVGCDPKHDSIATLCGRLLPTILETVREKGLSQESIDSVIFKGYNGTLGCESGGPRPATGCAGKGVYAALEFLTRYKVPERYGADVVIYDVLGDVVCGGFSQPMRHGYAKEIYMVGNGESLTLWQVNNVLKAVVRLRAGGSDVAVGGIIDNMRGVPNEEKVVEEFAKLIGVPVIIHIPRDKTVQQAEFQGKTVIEAFPDSKQAEVYRELAKRIMANTKVYVPKTVTLPDIMKIVKGEMVAAANR